MKKNVFKSAFAIACVVAASMGGLITYNQHNKNLAATNLLFAENVEALCQMDGDNNGEHRECDVPADPKCCWADNNPSDFRGVSWTYTKKVNSYGNCQCMGRSRSCPQGSSVR